MLFDGPVAGLRWGRSKRGGREPQAPPLHWVGALLPGTHLALSAPRGALSSAQVGGMGDVVTALGRAVQEEGHTVEVVVPKYDVINYDQVGGGAGCGVEGARAGAAATRLF
jgi:hypothetical protein